MAEDSPWLAVFIPAVNVVLSVDTLLARILAHILNEFMTEGDSSMGRLPLIVAWATFGTVIVSAAVFIAPKRLRRFARCAVWLPSITTLALILASLYLIVYIPRSDPFRGCPDWGWGPDRTDGEYNPAQLAQWANRFIAMKETDAFNALTRKPWLCRRDRWYSGPPFLLSSAVYGGLADKPLRPLSCGSVRWDPFQSADPKDWPNLPLVISGDIPFLVPDSGGMLTGAMEPPRLYLDYCRSNGTFRRTPYKVPTKEEAERALDTLFMSERWRRLKWTADSEAYVRRFLSEEAEAVK